MANSKWFTEAFGYSINGVPTSCILREVLTGNGSAFGVDLTELDAVFAPMKVLMNGLKANSHEILVDAVLQYYTAAKNSKKNYISGPQVVDGYSRSFIIEVVSYGRADLQIYLMLNTGIDAKGNNVYERSQFARFKYASQKFYWLLNTEWFVEFCEKMHTRMLEKKLAKLTASLVSPDVPDVSDVPVVVIPAVKQVLKQTSAAGKYYYWVFSNPVKKGDADYDISWINEGGSPTMKLEVAMEMADVRGAYVFRTTKKKMLEGDVIAQGIFYEGIPF